MIRIFKTLLIVFSITISCYGQHQHKTLAFRGNPNTENYDVTYHKLKLKVDPNLADLEGEITTHFVAKSDMTHIVFDLVNHLTVSSVTQGGQTVSFHQTNVNELTITLKSKLIAGNSSSVVVIYSGNPISNNIEQSYVKSTHGLGSPIIWTLSEPFGAKYWWPCKESLDDKVEKIDVYITAPTQFVAVSNGLEKTTTISGSLKTTHFQHNYPIPSYLIAMAVSNYEVYSHTVPNKGKPFDIVNYVYPESRSDAEQDTKITVDIMNLFIDLFGKYPFENEKYGHAQFGFGGGMEHTTVSFMQNFERSLIAHELAHQWFGDKVTCGSWKDIWLNEGFATYSEGIVKEHFDGQQNFKDWRSNLVVNITEIKDGTLYLKEDEAKSVDRIFSSAISYKKGAMVVHMLRRRLGDDDFFKGIKNYLNDTRLAYKYAKTPDLKEHLESQSGIDLTQFISGWVYKEGYPMYSVTWGQNSDNIFNLIVSQEQSNSAVSFFEANISVRLKGGNGEELDLVFNNNKDAQNFQKKVPFKVTEVEFDPDYHLISKNNSVTFSADEFQIIEEEGEGENEDGEDNVFIFPNPTYSEVKVKTQSGVSVKKIELFDFRGRKLISNKLNIIDLSKYSVGTYLVKVYTNKGVIRKSIIKK